MKLGHKKAVFLDRDGTIIEEKGYLRSPKNVIFFPNTIKALHMLQQEFLLFIITNQPGVGEGFISEEEVKIVNNFILSKLAEEKVKIEKIYYCPHRKTDNCICRKPNPYYIYKASEEYGLDIVNSFVLGDHPTDVEMAFRIKATGIYLLTGHGEKHLKEVPNNVAVVKDIEEAARYIISRSKSKII